MTAYADIIINTVSNVHRNGMAHTIDTYLAHKVSQRPELATDTFSVSTHSASTSGVAVTVHTGIEAALHGMFDAIDHSLKYDSVVEGNVTVGDIRVWADDEDHDKGFIGTEGYPEVTFTATLGDWGDCEVDVEYA